MKGKTRKLVAAALLAALTCVATLLLQFPAPMGGYVHMGDCLVLFSAWLLGPWWGAAAAGVGSMLADLIAYALYAPGTLVIKAMMAVAAGLLGCRKAGRRSGAVWLARAAGAVAAECLMVIGYFLYESLLLGYGWSAVANVPANGVQAAFGIVVGILLDRLLTDRLRRVLR